MRCITSGRGGIVIFGRETSGASGVMRIGRMVIVGSGRCRLVGGIGMDIGILLLMGRRVGGQVDGRFADARRFVKGCIQDGGAARTIA